MNNEISYFYSGAEPLLRIVVVGTLAFIFLLLSIRASGGRTLAKMNVFDFIITVGFGAVFGRILVDKSLSLSEGVLAFSLLIALQFVVSVGRLRWGWFKKIVDIKPTLVYYRGRYLEDAMKRARVCTSDVEGAVRHHNQGSFDRVEAVVLEAGGHFAVILKSDSTAVLASKLLATSSAKYVPNVAPTTPY